MKTELHQVNNLIKKIMKKLIYSTFFVLLSTIMLGQNKDFQLSSHILDVSKGLPAKDISIKLENITRKRMFGLLLMRKKLI